jgi:hypothetical protein
MKRSVLKRKTPLRKVSRETVKELAGYFIFRNFYLKTHPLCEFNGCMEHATELHHKRGRRHEYLTNERYIIAICMAHHRFIHDNGKWARANGLLI